MVMYVIPNTLDVRCIYKNTPSIFGGVRYTCLIENQGVLMINRLLGKHLNGYSNADVDIVSITDCHLYKVQKCLIDFFPNMRVLHMRRCSLEQICKEDLIPFRNLQNFGCCENQIRNLPGDLFEGFKNLECIDFSKNRLEIIEPNLLDGLTKLKNVNFSNNPNFNKYFSAYPNTKPNASLKQIKDELYEKFYAKYKYVRALKDSNDKLSKETQKLKAELKMSMEENLQSGLLGDIKMMLNNEDTKDLTIQIDNREFRVHKFVLASRSPFFAQMFKDRPDVDILKLSDLPYFGLIINYCYTDVFPFVPNFVDLLSVAGKLQILSLRNFAASMVGKHLNDDNAVQIFALSCKYNYECLMKKAYAKIKKKYSKYINFKDEWLTQPNDLVGIIEGFKKQDEEMKIFLKKFDNLSVK